MDLVPRAHCERAQGGSNEDIGVREYELRVRAENGQSLSFKVTAEIRAAGTSVLKIPTIHIPVPDPTVISLELLDGENWRVLKSKKVFQVKAPWAPSPCSARLASLVSLIAVAS